MLECAATPVCESDPSRWVLPPASLILLLCFPHLSLSRFLLHVRPFKCVWSAETVDDKQEERGAVFRRGRDGKWSSRKDRRSVLTELPGATLSSLHPPTLPRLCVILILLKLQKKKEKKIATGILNDANLVLH